MDITVKPGGLCGTVRAVPSKSEAHRTLICAALCDSPTDISIPARCEDTDATAFCLSALCADISTDNNGYKVVPSSPAKTATLDCGESGSTLRFLLPVAGAIGTEAEFIMHGRLAERPISPLDAVLESHGRTCRLKNGVLVCSGKLTGNDFIIDGGVSSQFISGLSLSLPLLGGGTVKITGKAASAGYIAMTLEAMRRFGVKAEMSGNAISVSGNYKSPFAVSVNGDWSNAAPLLCAGALNGDVTVTGLDSASTQGDRGITDILRAMGADISISEAGVAAKKSRLHGITFDAEDIPDLVPVLAATAAAAEGTTVITGASRLRLKESDRLAAVREVLTTLGGDVSEAPDGLVINGKASLRGGRVPSFGDHRIVMCAAVAAVSCACGVTITGAECTAKSYRGFWNDLTALGADLNGVEQ